MEKYTREWFKERAFKSIRKIDNNSWDYSDSLLLYMPESAQTYEALQSVNNPYYDIVTKPEHDYLRDIADDLASKLPNNFEYIDLGPGSEHKEQFLFDALKKQGKTFTYVPVDINDHFLDLAERYASDQGIPVRRIKSSFEELSEIIGDSNVPRFVSIGLTFSNYKPQEILEILKKIAGKNGLVFINSQMRDRIDMSELQRVYQLDSSETFDSKIELLGLSLETDVTARVADEGVRVWTTILNSNKDVEEVGPKKGDRLLVFQSLRYTKESLEKELVTFGEIYTTFDTGSSFIAALVSV